MLTLTLSAASHLDDRRIVVRVLGQYMDTPHPRHPIISLFLSFSCGLIAKIESCIDSCAATTPRASRLLPVLVSLLPDAVIASTRTCTRAAPTS